ncbi:DUF6236 family protein [Methylocapsa polymorpha]|uniref:DUF6236 family protein n=1 Tax=Methylocapsa polymorpha TaxID=3080828 RepID=A0ABZ0HU01_9HYPH|nr:DUF6236 family protein [Methylocapsa sp. RX1]
MEIQGTSLRIKSTNLDPQEIRFALLFWDQLVWPSSRLIHIMSGPDEIFLEQAGVLTRPFYNVYGDVAQGIATTQISAFKDLDKKEPGKWALAQGENSLLVRDRVLDEGRGALVELHRAIPVPDKDVPLNEILEFKAKRNDELQLLRTEIDALFATLDTADDKAGELSNHIVRIDAACANVLKIGKEWRCPVRLSNVKASVEVRPFVTAFGGIAAYELATHHALPASAAILAGLAGAASGTAPALKLSADFGWRGLRPRPEPYRYVYHFYSEVF